jgi:hypothetical protein
MAQSFCFVLVNQSTTTDPQFGGALTTPILQQIADVLGSYANDDVASAWGGSYAVRVGMSDGSDLAPGEAPCYIVDSLTNVPGAAAYHDRQADGTPIIYAARDEFTDLLSGSMALSAGFAHEIAEVIGDVGANRWADRLDGSEEALELCDRLQGTDYSKVAPSGATAMVANFLFPNAFDPGSQGPYDFGHALTAQTDQTPGGYVILRQQGQAVSSNEKGEIIIAPTRKVVAIGGGVTAASAKTLARKKHPVSRTYRRGVRLAA